MITLTTYNILHGYRHKQILKNIALFMEKGSDVICLQEADLPFETRLDDFLKGDTYKKWDVRYVHRGGACNLAILWNSEKITLSNLLSIVLPCAPSSHRQRGALSVEFLIEGKRIRITTAHLSWEGGSDHRFVQLRYLRDILAKNPHEHEILCGDFNTSVPARFRDHQKKKIQASLGTSWMDAIPDQVWTCDVSDSYPGDTFHWISVTLKWFGFKLRSCLDHMWFKNAQVISREMLDVPGSDHRPLIVEFSI